MKYPVLASIVVMCAIGCHHCRAADREPDIKQSQQAEQAAKTRRQQIQEEIKTLRNHEWAGEYYMGDGLGVNVSLILAPKSGYVFEWHGCLGLYDRNYGAVTEKNGRLRLSFTFPNKRQGFEGIDEEFISIPWGERRYLVPTNDVVGFCNMVNRDPQGSFGLYLLRDGDAKKDVKGFPLVPEKFQPYLLAHPIEATIVGVGKPTTRPSVCEWKFKDTPVTLNCGKKQGLLVGMELHVTKPENFIESVTVQKVEDEQSEAVMTQTGENEPGPRIGYRLSTRWP